ncbi:hypothetical protein [Paraburkholderia kururiensis]|uniref:hypothetical protein n=1 Tax=Paraburkholderia kururiensis TaxID=984307 RepID=UPI0012E00E95|nr:hypothetical protein [Paraburkholderia kururiensis]
MDEFSAERYSAHHEVPLQSRLHPTVYAHKPPSKWPIRLPSTTKSLKINFFKVKFTGIEKEVRIGG